MKHLDAIGTDKGKACSETAMSMSLRELELTSAGMLDGHRLDKAEHHRSYLAAAIMCYPDKTLRELIDMLP